MATLGFAILNDKLKGFSEHTKRRCRKVSKTYQIVQEVINSFAGVHTFEYQSALVIFNNFWSSGFKHFPALMGFWLAYTSHEKKTNLHNINSSHQIRVLK